MSAILFLAAALVAPEFHWESPPGVMYVELVCNGQSIGWRLAADGELLPRPNDFPNGNYSCVFKAYDATQTFMDATDPFTFTVFAPSPVPGTLRVSKE